MQLKPILRHTKQSNGIAVVVKPLYPCSDKLQILQHLHLIKSPFNPTIPLLRTVRMYLYMWKFIILPKATPLDLGFRLGILQSKVVDLGYQLIVGVGFLHHHGIAHLDIKPENIVVLQNQLFIINFDILVCVNGPDALINHWCRTPGWMAPEIGHEDGPKCLYSPITGWKIGFYW